MFEMTKSHFVYLWCYFSGALPASGPTGACNGTRGAAMDPAENCDSPGDRFIPALVIAQMIHGIGFSPMFTLGLVYIEENEEPSLAAVYIGNPCWTRCPLQFIPSCFE